MLFFRYSAEDPPVVERASNGADHPLLVRVKDGLTWGEEVQVPVDLVVLSVGMVPGKIPGLVDMLKLPVGSDGYLLEVHPKLRPVEVAVNGVLDCWYRPGAKGHHRERGIGLRGSREGRDHSLPWPRGSGSIRGGGRSR